MKADLQTITKMEALFQQYEAEIRNTQADGFLKPSASKTYLLHSGNFIRWCKGQFEPGGRNKK